MRWDDRFIPAQKSLKVPPILHSLTLSILALLLREERAFRGSCGNSRSLPSFGLGFIVGCTTILAE